MLIYVLPVYKKTRIPTLKKEKREKLDKLFDNLWHEMSSVFVWRNLTAIVDPLLPWVQEVTVIWPKQETARETSLTPKVIFCASLDKTHFLYLWLVENRACFSAWPITTRADDMHQSELGENVKRARLPSAGKWERLACLPASVSTQDCREAGARAVTFCVSLGKIHLFNKTIPNK